VARNFILLDSTVTTEFGVPLKMRYVRRARALTFISRLLNTGVLEPTHPE